MGIKTLLLVDDSETALLVETLLLEGESYRLLTAHGGREALELIHTASPDLVLLDLVMPDLDGIEVLRTLRANPKTRDLPVIMVTTRGATATMDRAYAEGCNAFITKPIDGLELLAQVRSCLGEVEP